MSFMRYIGGFVILFLLIGLLFKIGSNLINLMLLISALIFIFDTLYTRKKLM